MKFVFILVMIFSAETAWNQTLSKAYFDGWGEKCSPASSIYYLLGKKNRNGFFYDTLKSYYTKTQHIRSIELRDQYGNRMGPCEFFYENGKPMETRLYDRSLGKSEDVDRDSLNYKILDYYDDSGNRLVKNGDGFVNGLLEFDREQGKVVNGFRDSVWTVFYANGKVYCYESWQHGRLIDGISFDETGNEYYYKQALTLPIPVMGMQEFFQETSDQMTYPKEAERRGIQGKVLVEFTVEKDGTIMSPRILKGLGFGCDEEAIRALKSTAPWLPAKLRGQAVSRAAVIPILFKLK